jgi:hypothetical protein
MYQNGISAFENRSKISQLSEIAQKIYYMQNLPIDMNFNKNHDHMQFAALWPELLSKKPVSFFLRHPVYNQFWAVPHGVSTGPYM